MGAMPNEPSMEEILSSIKRIIAEEDGPAQAPRAPRRSPASAGAQAETDEAGDDQVLELTDALPGEPAIPAETAQQEPVMTASAPPAKPDAKPPRAEARAARPRAAVAPAATSDIAAVLSDDTARAARDSLVNLSRLLIRPEDGPSNTLEGLVREMLRPMLKEWLDAHLPAMVETMVKREIDRITGRV
jgi:cell pole-organizing protein PopZ